MAIKLILRAWKVPVGGNAKLVLMALSDYADEEGSCFPGIDKIAYKCGISESTVKRGITVLLKQGYVFKKRRFNTSNIYTVILPKIERKKRSRT